jgi:hypothetical protein
MVCNFILELLTFTLKSSLVQCNFVVMNYCLSLLHLEPFYVYSNLPYYYYYYYYYYIIISFMQGIHTYIPETNHVSRVHSVAAILRVLLMVHIMLSSLLNTFVLLH